MPLTLLEQEVFLEAGAWKNFIDLEESLSLDELIVLYEATVERQSRAMKAMAAAWGSGTEDNDSAIKYVYQDSDEGAKVDRENYTPIEFADPSRGGAVTPAFSAEEVAKLPINLGYSIIESE